MKNSLEFYIRKVISKNINTDWMYGSQCVDLVKHYCTNLIKQTIWTFWGSAKTGWENKSNTFPKKYWNKIINDFNKPNQVPNIWDIIFFNTWEYWHTGIVIKAYPWENKIKILEQNVWNWDWVWSDDRVKIWYYTYNNVLGWYSHKDFMVEYKWLPVFIVPQPTNKPKSNASYFKLRKYIKLYPRFFLKSDIRRNAILSHEFAHHVWHHKVPSKTQKLWTKISNFDKSIQEILILAWKEYTHNAYVTNYAKKNIREDWSECWEYYTEFGKPTFWDYRDIKVNAVIKLMKKYTIQ